jgi:hypothetical protein
MKLLASANIIAVAAFAAAAAATNAPPSAASASAAARPPAARAGTTNWPAWYLNYHVWRAGHPRCRLLIQRQDALIEKRRGLDEELAAMEFLEYRQGWGRDAGLRGAIESKRRQVADIDRELRAIEIQLLRLEIELRPEWERAKKIFDRQRQ